MDSNSQPEVNFPKLSIGYKCPGLQGTVGGRNSRGHEALFSMETSTLTLNSSFQVQVDCTTLFPVIFKSYGTTISVPGPALASHSNQLKLKSAN